MNTEALLKLAELLEEDAANPTGVKFDLGTWGKVPKPGVVDWLLWRSPRLDCGTKACAIGMACLHPWFNERGLKAAPADLSKGCIYPVCVEGDFSLHGFHGVAHFFGISHNEAFRLFSDESYQHREQLSTAGELAVAARIRQLVASAQPTV